MSAKRHYWSKMNHSEARSVTEIMTDEEAGRWLRGWLAGALGEDAQADGMPMEWKMGFSAGKTSFQDAQEFSRKQAERVSKRYTEATAVGSGSDFGTETTVEPSGIPELPITNKQTNKQDKNKEQQARRAAFAPPSEQEWVEYCAATWSDWHPVCAGEAWAYYQGVGWVVGRKPCRDWKATARTAHGNARQWGKLQPQTQQWAPQQPQNIVCRPGELDGIDRDSIGRL